MNKILNLGTQGRVIRNYTGLENTFFSLLFRNILKEIHQNLIQCLDLVRINNTEKRKTFVVWVHVQVWGEGNQKHY